VHLPLRGHVAVPGRDTEQERVEGSEDGWCDDGVVGLGRRIHLGENLLAQCLSDSVEASATVEKIGGIGLLIDLC